MNKKTVIFKVIVIFPLLFSAFSKINAWAFSNLAPKYGINFFDSIYDVDEEKLVAEIPSSNIKLYYVKDDVDWGMYEGFIIQINDQKKFYSWENVNSNRKPQLILSDLDKDGTDELIVILNTGYGTGVNQEDVHVIKQGFHEILVENPSITLHKNVNLKVTDEKVKVILNNKKTVLSKKKIYSEPYEGLGAGYGHIVRYEFNDNILYAIVPLGVGMNSGVGEFIVKYKYEDEILQVDRIDFVAVPKYIN